jgi:hypothetical protein
MEQKQVDELRALLAFMWRFELLKAILIDQGTINGPDLEEKEKALGVALDCRLEERARQRDQERLDLEAERLLTFLKEYEGTKQ